MGKIEPVSDYENRRVHGEALCDTEILKDHMQKVEELREQHKGYIDNLPSEPGAAFHEALKTMHPDSQQYPDGFEEALHLSQLIEEVLRQSDLDKDCALQEATAFAAMRCAEGLVRVQNAMDHISQVLSKAHRASQERG